jgi:hypothetical protein
MRAAAVNYLLTGFTESTGFRVFAFEGVTPEWERKTFSVKADLALARKHGIRVQELPLLCRAVLERRTDDNEERAFTFTEGDMTTHASLVSAAIEAHKKKAPRRPFAAGAPESAPTEQSASLAQPV